MDVGISLAVLPVALPVMGVIAAMVKVGSRGPVLFRQQRVGRDGRPFTMLKFRTMCPDAPARLRADPALYDAYVRNDFKLPTDTDPRVLPHARFLRRTSLDELPQLFNVLAGDMSLVGPRPVVPIELDRYGADAWAYLEGRPGITGRWQTDGRDDIRYPERAELDAEYVRTRSIGQDVAILVRTVARLLRHPGSA